MNYRRIVATVLLITLATAGAAACSDSGDKPAQLSTSTTSAPRIDTTSTTVANPIDTSTTTAPPEATHPAIEAALGFWDRYIEMTGRTGPFDPIAVRAELDEFTTGAETTKLFEFIQGNMATGRVLNGTMQHSPRLDALSDDAATVIDCLTDSTSITSADGTRVDTEDLRPHPATIGLRLVDGTWKVETVSIGAELCEP